MEAYFNYKTGRAQPVSPHAWWDDSKPKKVIYGPKGEVLKQFSTRRIGYFKEGN